MSLHIQWMRFKRECLAGRSRSEIAAAKDMFYAGAAAAADALLKLFHDDKRTVAQRLTSMHSIANEMEEYKNSIAARATK